MENRNCPICSNTKKSILYHQSFSGFSENNLLKSYDVVSCNNCGFCYADKIPSQQIFDKYYRDLSKYENFSDELIESPFDLKRFMTMVEYLKKFNLDKNIHIAEIGCATGFLLSLLKKEGYHNLTGIDPSPGCTNAAKKHYNITVLTNTLSNIELTSNSVDLMILVGVLEHVKDLDNSLSIIWNLLSDNGHFFIAVPDGSQYFNGKDAPYQEFSVEHINYFGPTSLENLMKKNGFEKIDISQEIIEVNYNTETPAILSLFKKVSKKDINLVTDKESSVNLKKYIQICKEKDDEINLKIETEIISIKKPVLVWGTGAQTLRLLANSSLKNAKIVGFIDSNPKYQGKLLHNLPVYSPNDLKDKEEIILISTRAYQNEIENQIKTILKLDNKVIKLF